MQDYGSKSAYRLASASGASHIGLLKIVYDAMSQHIRDAGSAVSHGDIAARCASTNRAMSLLAHLESWVGSLGEPQLVLSLQQFYTYLRTQLLVCQAKGDQAAFTALADLVTETRAAWHQKEQELTAQQIKLGSALDVPDDSRGEVATRRSVWSA